MKLLEFVKKGSDIILNLDMVTDVQVTHESIRFYSVNSIDVCVSLIIDDIEKLQHAKERIATYNKLASNLMRYCIKHNYVVIDSKTGDYGALE